MKLKSLLFGSAAAMVTVTGAQAADLPIAEPVEYVRICDAYGAGYYYLPGTETCLKVGGEVSLYAGFVGEGDDGDDDFYYNGDDDDDDEYNQFGSEAEGVISLDARTQTGIGIVRAYVEISAAYSSLPGYFDDFEGYGFDPDNDSIGGDAGLETAYIQILSDFGTLTAGNVDSFFGVSTAQGKDLFGFLNDQPGDTNLLAYTFAFGNGFSATLSLEDPEIGYARYGEEDDDGEVDGRDLPDLVANVRIDQGWGSAQVHGAVGQVNRFDDNDELGWAVGANVAFAIPNTMFELTLGADYAEGILSYVIDDKGDETFDFEDDGSDLNTAWSVQGGLNAGFTDTVGAFVSASYATYNDETWDDDWTHWAVNGGIDYTPVEGLLFRAEAEYQNIDHEDEVDGDIWAVYGGIVREF